MFWPFIKLILLLIRSKSSFHTLKFLFKSESRTLSISTIISRESPLVIKGCILTFFILVFSCFGLPTPRIFIGELNSISERLYP